jgi:(2Fe-2S) ferredoxin
MAFNEGDHVVFEREEVVGLHHQSLIVSEVRVRRYASLTPFLWMTEIFNLAVEILNSKTPDCTIERGDKILAKFERHVFVCTNTREPGSARPSCNQDGKGELHGIFKDKVKDAGLKTTVRANKAGCLDQCEHGPTVVVYPEAIWYGFVKAEDVDEIVSEHLWTIVHRCPTHIKHFLVLVSLRIKTFSVE